MASGAMAKSTVVKCRLSTDFISVRITAKANLRFTRKEDFQ